MPIKVRGTSGQVHEFYGCKLVDNRILYDHPTVFEPKDVHSIFDFYENAEKKVVENFLEKLNDTGLTGKGEMRYEIITNYVKLLAIASKIELVQTMPKDYIEDWEDLRKNKAEK
jgi:hypothetical protein